ncbi:hypothetical protein ACLESD_10815 [Pyxidicoccus sp. 3LFB2]
MTAAYPKPVADLLATFFVAGGGSAEVSDAAVRALEAGLDTPTLCMLAGLSGWTSPWELESLLGRLLRELGLPMPDRAFLVREMARPLARAFLAGRITPDAFAEQLYALSRQDAPNAQGHHPWCQLQDDWMLARDGTQGTVDEATATLRAEAERLAHSYD